MFATLIKSFLPVDARAVALALQILFQAMDPSREPALQIKYGLYKG